MEDKEFDNIVTLTNAKGENVDFIEHATIILPHGTYSILQPKNKMEVIEDNEAVVFKVIEDINNKTQSYELVIDTEILNEVFEEYNNSFVED